MTPSAAVAGRSTAPLPEFVRRHQGLSRGTTGPTGTRYWFIDEISGISGDWPNTIKNLRDNGPDFTAGHVVLTGSPPARLHEVGSLLPATAVR